MTGHDRAIIQQSMAVQLKPHTNLQQTAGMLKTLKNRDTGAKSMQQQTFQKSTRFIKILYIIIHSGITHVAPDLPLGLSGSC